MEGDVGHYIDQAVQTLRDGFANINNPKGLIIALIATVFMGSWRQLLPVALVATVAHIVIGILGPVLTGGNGQVRLPEMMSETFWTTSGVLFVGYLIVISILFFIKSMLFKGRGGH